MSTRLQHLAAGGIIVGVLAWAIADGLFPHSFGRLYSGIERMLEAAAGLLLGPFILVAGIASLVRGPGSDAVQRDDFIVSFFLVAFGLFMCWVFFF